MTQEHMKQNNVLNKDKSKNSKNYKYNSSNGKSKYCSKCLSLLDSSDEVVRDNEGNEFCDEECKQEYWAEIRREFDCQYREWRNGGR